MNYCIGKKIVSVFLDFGRQQTFFSGSIREHQYHIANTISQDLVDVFFFFVSRLYWVFLDIIDVKLLFIYLQFLFSGFPSVALQHGWYIEKVNLSFVTMMSN